MGNDKKGAFEDSNVALKGNKANLQVEHDWSQGNALTHKSDRIFNLRRNLVHTKYQVKKPNSSSYKADISTHLMGGDGWTILKMT